MNNVREPITWEHDKPMSKEFAISILKDMRLFFNKMRYMEKTPVKKDGTPCMSCPLHCYIAGEINVLNMQLDGYVEICNGLTELIKACHNNSNQFSEEQ